MASKELPHIFLKKPPDVLLYKGKLGRSSSKKIPFRNWKTHGKLLRSQLQFAIDEAKLETEKHGSDRKGIYLEFRGAPGFDLKTLSLENLRNKKIRLCNIRNTNKETVNAETGEKEEQTVVCSTLFSLDEAKSILQKIEKYLGDTGASGKRNNADFVNSIESVDKVDRVNSFWLDAPELIPRKEPEWCEVWLRGDTSEVVEKFENLLARREINFKPGFISFPERTVKLVEVSYSQLESLAIYSDNIAEYRKAKETAAFWLDLSPWEQAEWGEDLLERIDIDEKSNVTVCILDTGVNRGNPLLEPLLDVDDCQSVDSAWGSHDHDKHGHGTLMAGTCAYGDIRHLLEGMSKVSITHSLESVKILPPKGDNAPELWGDLTRQAVSIAGIQAPEKYRIICMAVTSSDTRDRGKPSSWSGAVDQIAFGTADGYKRLLILSNGNFTDDKSITNYPDSQLTDSIHDPAQAWNAISVGGITQLTEIKNSTLGSCTAIAGKNNLSPFTTTSSIWDEKWPIKPEVVFEAGNAAKESNGSWSMCDDLSLLSTYHKPHIRMFDSFAMTSASAALAANFAAKIASKYPNYWPETIRALMIHSAEWPDELREQIIKKGRRKTDIRELLRVCGYGVPDMGKALYSASNSLTLIAQSVIQPYYEEVKEGKGKIRKAVTTKDMHFYNLPWPSEVLESLGEMTVEMRITLSYFIEPAPLGLSWNDRYSYSSHGLRFDVNSPGESSADFVQRINRAARIDGESSPGTPSCASHWVIGSNNRDKGSIHSDVWQGTAADLAASRYVAVFPRKGWWSNRKYLKKYESITRYSLIVSIRTPEQTTDIKIPQKIDIYTPVLNTIKVKSAVQV